MEYTVYAIRSLSVQRIYVGMTSNLQQRLDEHNKGNVFSTKGFRPWEVIFTEKCGSDRKIARVREKYWKSGIGKEKLKNIPE